jgi:hypothetical protein
MKVAALGALSALIAFPAQAGQRNHQNNVSPFCDNDGRCTTFNLAAPVSSKTQSLRGRSLHRAVDCQWQHHDGDGANGLWLQHHGAPGLRQQVPQVHALLKERGYKVDPRINKCYSRGVTSPAPTITSAPLAIIRPVGIKRPPTCTMLAT